MTRLFALLSFALFAGASASRLPSAALLRVNGYELLALAPQNPRLEGGRVWFPVTALVALARDPRDTNSEWLRTCTEPFRAERVGKRAGSGKWRTTECSSRWSGAERNPYQALASVDDQVQLDKPGKRLRLRLGQTRVVFSAGRDDVLLEVANSSPRHLKLSAPARAPDGELQRLTVPLRDLARMFDWRITWNAVTRSADVRAPGLLAAAMEKDDENVIRGTTDAALVAVRYQQRVSRNPLAGADTWSAELGVYAPHLGPPASPLSAVLILEAWQRDQALLWLDAPSGVMLPQPPDTRSDHDPCSTVRDTATCHFSISFGVPLDLRYVVARLIRRP